MHDDICNVRNVVWMDELWSIRVYTVYVRNVVWMDVLWSIRVYTMYYILVYYIPSDMHMYVLLLGDSMVT